MKIITVLIIALSCINGNAFGQSKIKVIHKAELNKEQSFSFTVKEQAIYTATIIQPTGELLSKPIYKKEYKAGEKMQFNYKPEFLKAGKYNIVISNERREVSRSSFIIDANRKEKIELEKKRYQSEGKTNYR